MKNSTLDLQGLFNQIKNYYACWSLQQADDTEAKLKFLDDLVGLWEVNTETNSITVKPFLTKFGLKWMLQDVFEKVDKQDFIKDPEAVALSVYEELLAHNEEVAKKLAKKFDKFSETDKIKIFNEVDKIKSINYVDLTLSSFEERYLEDVEGKAQIVVSECKSFIDDVNEFEEGTVKVVLFCRKDSSKDAEKIKIGIFDIVKLDDKFRLATLRCVNSNKKELVSRMSDYLRRPKSKKESANGTKLHLKFYRETKTNDVLEFKTTIPLGEDDNVTELVTLSYTVGGIKSVVYPSLNRKLALLGNALSTTFSTDEWCISIYNKSEWFKVLHEGLSKARSKAGKKSMADYLNSLYCEASITYAGGKEKIICAHGDVFAGEMSFGVYGYPSVNIRKQNKQLPESGCTSSDCEIEYIESKTTEPAIDYSHLEYEELD